MLLQVVMAPHVYPPSISLVEGGPTTLGQDLYKRLSEYGALPLAFSSNDKALLHGMLMTWAFAAMPANDIPSLLRKCRADDAVHV